MQTPKAVFKKKFFQYILHTNACGSCKPKAAMLVITRETHPSWRADWSWDTRKSLLRSPTPRPPHLLS